MLLVAAPASVLAQTYAGPLVITQGGTYTGNYQSLSSGTPCVLVNTTQPVVLDGCYLQGAGTLIQSGSGANLTVRNCRGTALAPTVDGQPAGHFLDTYQSQSLVVEHNYLSGTTGIIVNRWTGNAGTLTVRYNQARNIDGRWRNNGGFTRSSFLQLNTVSGLSGVEIAYNEVINTPNQSLVEDNINFYNASGTAGSPIRVHDNFVRGAYPYPATAGSFTGTGLTTDGDANNFGLATGYIEASANQFVGTCNAAMNIAAGHDVYYHDNRLVTSALLADGTHLNATYAATGVFNYYNQLASIFFNNRIENNTIGYVKWGANNPLPDRQDLSPGSCATCNGNVNLPNPITVASEDNEYALWQQKVQQANVTLGPLGGAAPTPAPAPAPATGSIANAGFEDDNAAVSSPTGWQTTTGNRTNGNADYTETYPGAHTGSYHGTHYRPEAYEVYTYQTVTGLANGTYTLAAWVKSSGGQNTAQLQAKNYGGSDLSAPIAAASSWVQVTVPGIVVSNGQCEIGVYSNANPGNWLYFDDFTLVPTAATANVPPVVSLAAAATLTLGQPLVLSATATDANGSVAKVGFYAGTTLLGETTTAPYQLSWTPTAAGSYSLTAVATDNAGASATSAVVAVTVAAPAPAPTGGTNLLTNPGFEADGVATGTPTGWQKAVMPGTSFAASYTEAYGTPHSGSFHGTHYQPTPYEVYTFQIMTNVPNGTYRLRAWIRSSGGQPSAYMLVRNYGGAQLTTATNFACNDTWTQIEIANIPVTSGSAEVGFFSKANGGQGMYFDDVEFVAQSAAAAPTNTVLNASFDDDQAAVLSPRQWTTRPGGNTLASTSYTETYWGAHSGTYHGTHYSPLPYEVYTYQTVTGLANGTYTLTAWVRGTAQSGGQLQAKGYGGPALAVNVPNSLSQWTQITITGITVSNGQCEIGFYSNTSGLFQWIHYDDVELKQTAASTKTATAVAASTAAANATGNGPGTSLGLYPNPADGQTTLTASFAQADYVTFTILDYQGTQLAQYQRTAQVGSNDFALDTSTLPSGSYTLQVTSSSQGTQVVRLAVAH